MLQNASVLCSLWSPNNTLLYRYVIYSSIDGHLCHSSLGAIINNSPGNICVQVFAWTYSFIKECSCGVIVVLFLFLPAGGATPFSSPIDSVWEFLKHLGEAEEVPYSDADWGFPGDLWWQCPYANELWILAERSLKPLFRFFAHSKAELLAYLLFPCWAIKGLHSLHTSPLNRHTNCKYTLQVYGLSFLVFFF